MLPDNTTPADTPRTYTHPDVFTVGVRDDWADPATAPPRPMLAQVLDASPQPNTLTDPGTPTRDKDRP